VSPVRFEFNVEPEPQKPGKRKKAPKQETQEKPPQRVQRSRRVRLGHTRTASRSSDSRSWVQDFERQERELVKTITSLRQMLRPVGD